MIAKPVEQPVVLVTAQVHHRRVMADELGQVRRHEHLRIEAKDAHRDVLVSKPRLDAGYVSNLLDLRESDPDAGGEVPR